jgi:hypothetical protein
VLALPELRLYQNLMFDQVMEDRLGSLLPPRSQLTGSSTRFRRRMRYPFNCQLADAAREGRRWPYP